MEKQFTPKKYQREGSYFLFKEQRGCLFVDMGLGKTMIVLDTIHFLLDNGLDDGGDFLIVAPAFVARTTWGNEVKKWQHTKDMDVVPITGTPKERLMALLDPARVKTINYENLQWLERTCVKNGNWPFTTIVFDESTRLKSFRAHYQNHKQKDGSIRTVLHRTNGSRASAVIKHVFRDAKHVWLLTGTPCQNSLADLWGQLFFIDGGKRLGYSFTEFEKRFFDVDKYTFKRTAKETTKDRIMEAIKDVTFTLRAEDYLKLEGEIVQEIVFDLPPDIAEKYRTFEKDCLLDLEATGKVETFSLGAKLMKCRQIANGAVYYDDNGNFEILHNAKIEALESVVEAANGTPILVAYWFKSDLAILQKSFPKGRVFDGKPNTYRDFESGKIPLLFIHPQSAGHGVDGLQHTTNIICFYSLDWNAELMSQAVGRIGQQRQAQGGYQRPTMVYRLIARNTVDEALAYSVDYKVSVENAVKKSLARRFT